MKTVIIIEHLASGQPRPYADSRWHARIVAERHGVYTDGRTLPCNLNEADAKELAKRFVRTFVENGEWHQPKLAFAKPVNPKIVDGEQLSGEWEILITQEYLD